MTPILVGSLYSRPPLALAEVAIGVLDDLAVSGSAMFTLLLGADRRLRVHKWRRGKAIEPTEFVANFTKRTNPDLLAEDIAAMRGAW